TFDRYLWFCLQIPTGNSLCESYYKKVDTAYTRRMGAREAALFLKKSGLLDIILGKVISLLWPPSQLCLAGQSQPVQTLFHGARLPGEWPGHGRPLRL
uniref:Uncharacterized protein n=1 Tax=Theropithecus gelada TaxID=9565 RepID=A0A8D2FV90_THEGE